MLLAAYELLDIGVDSFDLLLTYLFLAEESCKHAGVLLVALDNACSTHCGQRKPESKFTNGWIVGPPKAHYA